LSYRGMLIILFQITLNSYQNIELANQTFIRTLSPSIFVSYVLISLVAGPSKTFPLVTSNMAPCQGQVMTFPSR